ncbi:MAG: tRNA (adenosine(37)-N6)-dimethylallyltransferase MiaA [Rhodospirillales bacterium]|nr:tRNA (adenosine(37)-N6)-dimethylallyltransferase MiaA [Rhodospirillales bacterium]
MNGPEQTVYVIAGPTASGKSARALELAADKDGIIINADSVQVYDALPTLAAQPSLEEQAQIPHELYGVLPPAQPCSAGNWCELALPVIERVLDEGRVPIVVGGSGLYIKALMEGLSPIPDIPDDVRQATVERHAELGNPDFHAALRERDPVMADRFHPFHTARLIRAWEVLEATGKSLAEWQKMPAEGPPPHWKFDVTLVMPARDVLYDRCNRRFDVMLEHGALDEVKALDDLIRAGDVLDTVPVAKALGFRQLQSYLAGDMTLEEAVEKAKAKTRQFAKQQVTWFRHQVKPAKNVDVKIHS